MSVAMIRRWPYRVACWIALVAIISLLLAAYFYMPQVVLPRAPRIVVESQPNLGLIDLNDQANAKFVVANAEAVETIEFLAGASALRLTLRVTPSKD